MELRLAQASNASVTCHDSVIKGTRKDAAARFDSCITRAKESNENRRSFLANPGYVRSTLRSATVSNEPAFFFVLLHFFACPCDALSKIFSKMHSSWSYPRCADKYLLNLERKSTRKTDRRLSCSCNNTLRRGKYIVPKTPQCWSQFLSTLPAKDVASTLCFGVQARSIFPHSIESMFWMLLSATVRGRFVGNI